MPDINEIRKSLQALENPYTPEGARQLLKDNPYDNAFESQEIREFISPSNTDSKYITEWDNPFDTEAIERKKEDRQPWISKVGAGLSRIGTKVVAEIAKMPGVLGGVSAGIFGQIDDVISGQDNTDFVKTAFDNAWIQSITDMEEHIKDEYLPVYVKKAVREGNLWDNITSVDFWATEGADGIGYIASMLAPGAAISKFGVGSKLLGVNKFTEMASKAKNADNILTNMSKLGYTAKNADLATATMANTLFEAAAEAKGAMDSYRSNLDNQLANGIIDKETYDNLISKDSEIGRNVFISNAAILIVPNAIMSKMLWGKPRNKAAGSLLKDGELAALSNPSLKIKAGRVGKDILNAGAREGLWEEGMQSTVESYFTENPDKGLTDSIGDLPKAYLDMFTSTEGQKAIFLGALLGGGMQSYQGVKSRKKERENTNKLVEAGNNMLNDFYNVFDEDIYEKDEDGNIIFTEKLENGETTQTPKINGIKFIDKLKSSNQIEYISAVYDLAVEKGDTEKINDIKELLTTHLIKPFIVNDDLGIDVLKQHLEQSSKLAKTSEREKSDNAEFIRSTIQKAEQLKKDYNRFQDFAPTLFKLDNENATKQDKVDFYNKLSMQYVDNKARQYYTENKLNEKEQLLSDLVKDTGRNYVDIKDNASTLRDLGNSDSRIKKVHESVSELTQDKRKIDDINNAFWDNKSVVDKFNQEINEQAKFKAEEEKIEKETTELLDKIKNIDNVEELDNIEVPQNIATQGINDAIDRKRKEIILKNSEKATEASEESEEFINNKNAEALREKEALDYISNNFSVGELVSLPDLPSIPEKRRGTTAEIINIGDSVITFKTSEGEEFSWKLSTFANAFNNVEGNTTTEGDVDGKTEEQEPDTSGEKFERRNQPRIIITDNNKGNKLDFVDQAALDFERVPRDKTGEEKGIELNEGFSENQNKALTMLENKDFSDIEFLIDNLPLNIKLTDDISAPLETRSETSTKYNETFDKTSRDLRKTIIKELQKGTKIEDITVPIAGQWNGTLSLEENVVENPITGLYEFSGDISKIKNTDIYFVDDYGSLINVNDDILPTNRRLAKGEVYIKIKTASGQDFPLKLNVKKLTQEKAELLYELYKYRFDEQENKTLSSLDSELWNNIKTEFNDILSIFDKSENDITIKDLIEFLVWEGSKNPKTQIKFTKKGELLVFDKVINKEDFNKPENKDLFIYTLTNNKRHQIKFKRKITDNNNLNVDENRKYLEYLITSGTLNTNAKISEPTFQGKTTMYLAKDKVKVKGNLSEFNADVKKDFSDNVIGNNAILKQKLPGLFSKTFTLSADGSTYIDEKGEVYNRATSLKDNPFNSTDPRITNAATRGDVVDELTRLFFSNNLMSEIEFIKRGKITLDNVNKEKNTKVTISNRYFSSLYSILEDYRGLFSDLNYTIYSNTPSVGGKLGNKGNIAGTVDLLAFDNKSKEWVLIDLKTSTQDRTNEYSKEENPDYVKKKGYSYKSQDTIQLNTYRELFKQMTNQPINKLFILPLTSKSEDTDNLNSTFDEITKPTKDLLVTIDSSSNIFELISIEDTKEKESDLTPEEVEGKSATNELFKQLGITVKATVPTKIVKPEVKHKISKEIEDKIKKEAVASYTNGNYVEYPVSNKLYYIGTDSFTIIDAKESIVITNKEKSLKIIKDYNKVAVEMGRLDYIKAEKVWNDRVVDNVIKVESTGLDFNSLSDVEANGIITKITKGFPLYIKEFQTLSKTKNSAQEKAESLYKFLQDKNITESQIKTKCGI